jgi:hypothetical protein
VIAERGDEGIELVRDLTGGDGTVDRTIGLAEVPDGYRAMAGRQVLKVLIRP